MKERRPKPGGADLEASAARRGDAAAQQVTAWLARAQRWNAQHADAVEELVRLAGLESATPRAIRAWQLANHLVGSGMVDGPTLIAARQRVGGAAETKQEAPAPAAHLAAPPVPADAEQAATDAAADDAVAPIDAIIDHSHTEHRTQLHPDEIFANVGKNTDSKRAVFAAYNQALRGLRSAEATLAKATKPKAKTKAAASVATATKKVDSTRAKLIDWIVGAEFEDDEAIVAAKEKLAEAKKAKEAKKVAALTAELKKLQATARAKLRTEVEERRHSEPGHTDESVYDPVDTEVTRYDFEFPDGEHVEMRDRVVAYATTAPLGVDTDSEKSKEEKAEDRDNVDAVMEAAGLSSSKLKILRAISGFEGGFDSVNTYDRKDITWGYVQWAGARASDLVDALRIIKADHPEAFERNFVAYGIDVAKVGGEWVISVTPPDGSPPLVGDEAGEAMVRNPRLAAVMSHAGRDEDIQKGQVQAAVKIEIDRALAISIHTKGTKKHKSQTFRVGDLLTSEYAVGLLANTAVHSGHGAARSACAHAVDEVLSDHAYVEGEEWAARAETAMNQALAAKDASRAVKLGKVLDKTRGSYVG